MLFTPWYVSIVLISVAQMTTFGQTYNCINEKWSSIGSMALKIIKSHIKTLGDDQSGHEWLHWAVQVDGPLFFKVLTPYSCPSNCKDPGYVVSQPVTCCWTQNNGMPLSPQNPQGCLMSKFMLQLTMPFLLLKLGSVAKPTYPWGLFSLVMVVVCTQNLNILSLTQLISSDVAGTCRSCMPTTW